MQPLLGKNGHFSSSSQMTSRTLFVSISLPTSFLLSCQRALAGIQFRAKQLWMPALKARWHDTKKQAPVRGNVHDWISEFKRAL